MILTFLCFLWTVFWRFQKIFLSSFVLFLLLVDSFLAVLKTFLKRILHFFIVVRGLFLAVLMLFIAPLGQSEADFKDFLVYFNAF